LVEKGYETKHVSYIDFAWEKIPPKVISWNIPPDHPSFNAEGLELSMSFRPAGNGDVVVKGPVEGIAFNNHRGKWDLAEYFRDGKLILALAPRDRQLQHEAIIFTIKQEKVRGSFAEVRIPKEVAEIFFTQEGGRLKLSGAQLNFNVVVGEDEGGLRLVEVAADYNPHGGKIFITQEISEVSLSPEIIPPGLPRYLDPGFSIPPFIFSDKTPGPGEYREQKPSVITEPSPPRYLYYTSPYFQALEWVRKHGKKRVDVRDLQPDYREIYNETVRR